MSVGSFVFLAVFEPTIATMTALWLITLNEVWNT
jgi:hypothetical protein